MDSLRATIFATKSDMESAEERWENEVWTQQLQCIIHTQGIQEPPPQPAVVASSSSSLSSLLLSSVELSDT